MKRPIHAKFIWLIILSTESLHKIYRRKIVESASDNIPAIYKHLQIVTGINVQKSKSHKLISEYK